jgi:hypothetical protein
MAWRSCKREGRAIEQCNIHNYHLAVLMKKCQRETKFEPATPKEVPVTMPPGVSAKPKFADPLATNIEIRDLELGVFLPRMQFDPKYVAKLAEDIEAEGQLQLIVVRNHPTKKENTN